MRQRASEIVSNAIARCADPAVAAEAGAGSWRLDVEFGWYKAFLRGVLSFPFFSPETLPFTRLFCPCATRMLKLSMIGLSLTSDLPSGGALRPRHTTPHALAPGTWLNRGIPPTFGARGVFPKPNAHRQLAGLHCTRASHKYGAVITSLWLAGVAGTPPVAQRQQSSRNSPTMAATHVVMLARPAAHKGAPYRHTRLVIIHKHPTSSAYNT